MYEIISYRVSIGNKIVNYPKKISKKVSSLELEKKRLTSLFCKRYKIKNIKIGQNIGSSFAPEIVDKIDMEAHNVYVSLTYKTK